VANDRILLGLAMRLLAVLGLSTMSALVKLAQTRGAAFVETMFFRQLCAVPVAALWVALGPGLPTLKTERFWAHVTRTAVGMIGMVFTFGSITLLPLAEATTLQFTVPIFATLLGALWLREPTGWHRWGAVIIGFAGVLIVAQPGGGHFPLFGAGVGLIAALFVAIIAILLRQLGRTENTGTTVFWFSLLSCLPLGVGYLFVVRGHDPLTWALLVTAGIAGGIGQLGLTAALRYAPVSVVVPMDYSGLVWGTLYGWLFFAALPTPGTWIGAPIIVASGLYIVWREQRRRLPSTPPLEPMQE